MKATQDWSGLAGVEKPICPGPRKAPCVTFPDKSFLLRSKMLLATLLGLLYLGQCSLN